MNYVKLMGMERPNLFMSIKIADLFNKGYVGCISIYDDDLERYDAAIIKVDVENVDFEMLEEGEYEVLFSPGVFKWIKEEDAIFYINKVLDSSLTVVQTMSN